MPHTVTVIFGEIAARKYEEGERSRSVLEEYGTVETFTFDTEPEVLAFKLGVNAGKGWFGYEYAKIDTLTT